VLNPLPYDFLLYSLAKAGYLSDCFPRLELGGQPRRLHLSLTFRENFEPSLVKIKALAELQFLTNQLSLWFGGLKLMEVGQAWNDAWQGMRRSMTSSSALRVTFPPSSANTLASSFTNNKRQLKELKGTEGN